MSNRSVSVLLGVALVLGGVALGGCEKKATTPTPPPAPSVKDAPAAPAAPAVPPAPSTK